MSIISKHRTKIFATLALVIVAVGYAASAHAAVWCWNPYTGWVFYPYASFCTGG